MPRKSAVTRIAIEGELSIFTADAQRQNLLDAFGTGRELEVDLSQVSEFDSAGVQLMVAAKREAAQRNQPLRFTGHSPAVLDIIGLCNLVDHLGDPVPDQSRT